jgi:hypothetical protein
MEKRKFLTLPGPIYLLSILILSLRVWMRNPYGDNQECLDAEGRLM